MNGKYKDFTKDILFVIAAVGVVSIAATSPNFLLKIARYVIKNRKYLKNKYDEKKVAKAIQRLKNNRLIILTEEDGKFKVELAERGKRKVEEIRFEDMKIQVPRIWDGKWRIIIFDIPEKQKKRARDALREKLQKLKFYQLQKSVWVCPYPCEKEIQFLCELFGINPFVNIIIADKIYNDIQLKKHFKLL